MTSVTLTIHVRGQRATALIIFLIHVYLHVYLTILIGRKLSREVYIYIYK